MRVSFWGTRGSLASPGPETARFGGNTSCVEVRADDGTTLVLDAGTGIRRLGHSLPSAMTRVDVLLSHLHMDHIQGLGFFAPLQRPGMEVHIWGPPSLSRDLRSHLIRYLSPPLFPVHMSELSCCLELHAVAGGHFQVGPFRVEAELVCHPGITLGYRIAADGAVLTYLPDHELSIGGAPLDADPRWISGFDLAQGADLLVHDAQYAPLEYARHQGWGHSTTAQVVEFAARAGVRQLVLFHHSPDHDDATLDRMAAEASAKAPPGLTVSAAAEGSAIAIP